MHSCLVHADYRFQNDVFVHDEADTVLLSKWREKCYDPSDWL